MCRIAVAEDRVSDIWEKLNPKDQSQVVVLNAPACFAPEVEALSGIAVERKLSSTAVGFEGVWQVAIDEDWSALRFRRIEYIKKMTRDKKRAMTPAGRAKTAKP